MADPSPNTNTNTTNTTTDGSTIPTAPSTLVDATTNNNTTNNTTTANPFVAGIPVPAFAAAAAAPSPAIEAQVNQLIAMLGEEGLHKAAPTIQDPALREAVLLHISNTPHPMFQGAATTTTAAAVASVAQAANGLTELAGKNPVIEQLIESKVWPLPSTVTFNEVVRYAYQYGHFATCFQ